MFKYCKICPCNVNNVCTFDTEEELIDDSITFCLYPKMYDKKWYNQYIKEREEKKNDNC